MTFGYVIMGRLRWFNFEFLSSPSSEAEAGSYRVAVGFPGVRRESAIGELTRPTWFVVSSSVKFFPPSPP